MGVPRTIRYTATPREMDSRYQKIKVDYQRARDVPPGTSRLFSAMRFYYVYVIQSDITPSWIYVGYTENLRKRLSEHNQGNSI